MAGYGALPSAQADPCPGKLNQGLYGPCGEPRADHLAAGWRGSPAALQTAQSKVAVDSANDPAGMRGELWAAGVAAG